MIVREYEKDEITVSKVPLLLMGGIVAISLVLTAGVSFGVFERQSVPAEARAAAGISRSALLPQIGPIYHRRRRFHPRHGAQPGPPAPHPR